MRTLLCLIVTMALVPGSAIGQAPTADKALAQLQGTWRLVAREVEGKKATAKEVKSADAVLVFKGDRVRFRSQGEDIWEATLKLDPAKSPPTVEVTHVKGPLQGKTGRAIYKLSDGRLTVCFSLTQLPTDFTTEDTDRVLVVYQREKQ